MTSEELKAETDHIASLYTPVGFVPVLSATMQQLALRFAREEIAGMGQSLEAISRLDLMAEPETVGGVK